MGQTLMENRSGLVVDVSVTHATGTAERDAADVMVKRTINKPGATLGADKNYDTQAFVAAMRQRKIMPHVASKEKGSASDPPHHTTRRLSEKPQNPQADRSSIFGWRCSTA